jgi:tRNA(Ile2) C34 agmatinyltransferase TiaS
MFDPTNQDVICPQCRRREVHFDSKIGFHCTACGREFTPEEAKVLVEHEVFQTGTENRS